MLRMIKKKIRRLVTRYQFFILRYRFKIGGNKIENCFITCSGKTDGIGAQVQAILSTMLFAKEFCLTYVHTPFTHIEHNELNENWEDYFNLGKDELTIGNIKRSCTIAHLKRNLMKFRYKSNTLYSVFDCHLFADIYPDRYSRITDRFIEKYMSSSKKAYNSYYEAGKINIAVHVRRGDVCLENVKTKHRYTDNLYYQSLLCKIISILNDFNVDVSIHLYSQGSIEDFHELKEIDINYHLDECALTTFYNLTSTDILVMSKSSYVYSAALLSKAIKIHEPFWHKPCYDWIVTNWSKRIKQVMFDESILKERVHGILAQRRNL